MIDLATMVGHSLLKHTHIVVAWNSKNGVAHMLSFIYILLQKRNNSLHVLLDHLLQSTMEDTEI